MEKWSLSKSFLTGVLHDCFKFTCANLNEGDKVCECYSCLKMLIQTHLNVSFITKFFIKRASLKLFNIYMKLLQSGTIFTQKNNHDIILSCNLQFKKYNCNSTHIYNRKIWVGIPSYIIFPCSYVFKDLLK